MITCPKCSKENQDHYKFCLGCGAELPRDVSPKKFAPGTPPQGVPAVVRSNFVEEVPHVGSGSAPRANVPAPVAAEPVAAYVPVPTPIQPALFGTAASTAPASASSGTTCPQCQEPNPSSNKFCALCGFKLAKAASLPTPSAPPAPAPVSGTPSVILTALRADGTEAGSYAVPGNVATIGRDTGAIFAGDSYLSPRHATFAVKAGKLTVKDESSLNGVYRKLRPDEPVLVEIGDVFRIGQEIIRVEALSPSPPTADHVDRLGSPAKGYIARLALIIGRDATGNAFPIPDTGLHLGRERGDILFPEDGYVSGLHCTIAYQGGRLYLTDLGSSNGSFVRLYTETEVHDGDILLMGQQLFRVNT